MTPRLLDRLTIFAFVFMLVAATVVSVVVLAGALRP
jgi:hypothetical protein